MKTALIIAVMAIVTALLRFLPFLVFRSKTPKYVSYLGKVLPSAVMGMLVIYCLKDVTPMAYPYGIPEPIAVACVAGVQAWKRSTIASILSGTLIYMVLIQLVF